MAVKDNTWCSICGAGYYTCNACGNKDSLKSWRVVADNINHYSIYLVLHKYTLSGDKEAARKELLKLDLSDKETFIPRVKARIEEILEDEKKSNIENDKKNINVVEETDRHIIEPNIDEEINLANEVDDLVEEPKKIKYVPKNRRRNNSNLGNAEDVE